MLISLTVIVLIEVIEPIALVTAGQTAACLSVKAIGVGQDADPDIFVCFSVSRVVSTAEMMVNLENDLGEVLRCCKRPHGDGW